MLVKAFGSLILGFLLAILVYSIFFTIPIPWIYSAVLFVSALVMFIFSRSAPIIIGAFFMIGIGCGLLRYSQSIDIDQSVILDPFVQESERISVLGTIASEPIVGESYTEFVITTNALIIDNIPLALETKILVKTDIYNSYEYADQVMVTAAIEKPEAFETDTERIFDYASYLGKDDVYYIMSYAESSILAQGRGFINNLYKFKKKFLNKIYRIIPEPESGLLAGILFGQKSALSDVHEDQFRKVGLMHIVVLSGYNVAIVIHLLLRMLAFLPLRIRSLIAVLGIAVFALLVGGGPTVIRASIMAVFIVLADILGAQYHIKRALVIAAVIMVMINPKILFFDISFQLSFLATYGLIAFSPWLEEKFSFLPKFFAIRDSAVATIAAQIMVMPLILYRIGELSLIAPVANVAVLFAVPFAMLFGFVTAAVSFISEPFAYIFGFISTYLLRYQLWVVEAAANIPFASISLPPFPAIVMIIMYVLIFWWIQRINRNTENMV